MPDFASFIPVTSMRHIAAHKWSDARWNGFAVGIFVLAMLLRSRGILAFPFDQDELYTVVESTHLLNSPLRPGIEGRPLYYLLQHPLLSVLPHTPFWVRLPALLFGLAGVWFTGLLARRIAGGMAGIAAMVFITMSPWHLYASGMARYWSLVYLAAAGFWLAYLRAQELETPRSYALALLPLSVGMLSHPTFAFPLPVALVTMQCLGVDGKMRWRWPSSNAWMGLWVPFLLIIAGWWLFVQSLDRVGSIRNFNGRGLVASLKLLPAMVQWIGPSLAAAAAAGAILGWRRGGSERRWSVVAAGGGLGGAALLLAASFVTDVYADYGMALLPFAFTLAGVFVAEVSSMGVPLLPTLLTSTSVILVTLAGVLPSTASHLMDGTRFDYRPAFERIRAAGPDRLVVTTPLIQRNAYAPELRAAQLEGDRAMLDSLLRAEQDLWLVLSVQRSGILLDGSGIIRDWSRRHCHMLDAWERTRLDYRTYRVELHWCLANLTFGAGPAPNVPEALPLIPGSSK